MNNQERFHDHIRGGRLKGVRESALLEDVNVAHNNNEPLMMASRRRSSEIVRFLLSLQGVDPKALRSKSIRLACKEGTIGVLEALLKDGRANPGILNSKSLTFACTRHDEDKVRMLLQDKRVNPCEAITDVFLHDLCTDHRTVKVVRAILEDGRVDPTFYNSSILFTSLYNDNEALLKLLLDDGRIDISVRDDEAICRSCRIGNVPMATLLIDSGRANHIRAISATIVADRVGYLSYNKFEILKLLIKTGSLRGKKGMIQRVVAKVKQHFPKFDIETFITENNVERMVKAATSNKRKRIQEIN